MEKKVLDLFLPLDELEKEQQKTGRFVKEDVKNIHHVQTSTFRIEDMSFFNAQTHSIVIKKHRRFAPYPLHNHDFLEFNYMLQGQSKQIVNGRELLLKEKEILLLDTDAKHQLDSLGKEDILINFFFKKSNLSIDLLKKLDNQSEGLAYDFFVNTILSPMHHENFLVLDLKNTPAVQTTLEQMILEYFNVNGSSQEIIHAMGQVLFYQLSRVYHSQMSQIYTSNKTKELILPILQKIEKEYRTITLTKLADYLGYNANYVSNLVKAKTGKTFTKLVCEQRLKQALQLVETTQLSIDDIAEFVGYSNKTDFYRKFRRAYHTTPSCLREEKQCGSSF